MRRIRTTQVFHLEHFGRMAELADAQDLKSCGRNLPCGFESRSGYLDTRILSHRLVFPCFLRVCVRVCHGLLHRILHRIHRMPVDLGSIQVFDSHLDRFGCTLGHLAQSDTGLIRIHLKHGHPQFGPSDGTGSVARGASYAPTALQRRTLLL